MPKDRLVRLSYDMLLYFDDVGHTNWVTHVRSDLCMNGFAYIWNNQNVENPSFFLKTYVNRLIDQHQQSWTASCKENAKLFHYSNFKKEIKAEPYVYCIDVKKFLSSLATFRSSSHCLLIEEGRHIGIPREFRSCIYCDNYTEDEFHFLMECPLYSNIRLK